MRTASTLERRAERLPGCPTTGPAAASVRPGPDSTYADGDDSSWMEVDWPSMTRRLEVDGQSVGVIDTGGDGPPLLFLHGLGGIWQNWLLNIPAFMDTHRCVAIDLPGFGLSEMPATRSRSPASPRTVDKRVRRARDRRAGGDRQLDGRLRRRRAGRLVPDARLEARAGVGGRALDRVPGARAAAGRSARLHGADGAHGAARHAGGQAAAAAAARAAGRRALPGAAVGAARHRARARRQRPRLHRRVRGADELLVPRQARADRGADADRVGAQRHARAGRGRRDVRAPDRRERPQRDLRGHRAPADARAPDALQRAAARVHRRRARAGSAASRASARDRALGGARDQLRVLGQHAVALDRRPGDS